jgi:hypothetical protein
MSKNLRKLSKRCDALFSLKIRKEGKCRRCPSKDNLQCSHFVSRRYHNTRWNLSNACACCKACHFFLTTHPLEAEKFAIEVMTKSNYEAMKQIALAAPIKTDYEDLIERLKNEL